MGSTIGSNYLVITMLLQQPGLGDRDLSPVWFEITGRFWLICVVKQKCPIAGELCVQRTGQLQFCCN